MNAPVDDHYYIICGRVFDPDKKNFGARIIEVRGGVFISVTPLMDFPEREVGVEVFDLLHYTLFPLLVDARVHSCLDPLEARLAPCRTRLMQPDGGRSGTTRQHLKAAGMTGVGLVRDLGNARGAVMFLDRIGTEALLPRVLSAGPGICLGKDCRCVAGVAAAGRESVARTVRRLIDDPQVEFIRLVLSGILNWETGEITRQSRAGLDELPLAVQLAHEYGKPVMVECSGEEGTRRAVEAGADFIEHGYLMSNETMDLLGEKKLVWTPVLAPLEARLKEPFPELHGAKAKESFERILSRHQELLRYAYTREIRIMAGSDAGSPGVPHRGGLFRELEMMQEAGLPTDELLAIATTRSADLLGQEIRIAPGLPANFVAVKGSVKRRVADLHRIEWVARNGEVFPVESAGDDSAVKRDVKHPSLEAGTRQ